MKAAASVVEGLNAAYILALTFKEQTHKQENVFEAAKYKRLKHWFDKLTKYAHKVLIHELVDWFAEHGVDSDSKLLEVRVAEAEEPSDAFMYTLDLLTALDAAYRAACEAVEDVGDYVTQTLIHKHLKKIERWTDKAEAELATIAKLGPELYLQKMK